MATEYIKNVKAEYGDIEIYVNNEPWTGNVEIYILVKQGYRLMLATYEKGEIVLTEKKEGAYVAKPFIKIPKDIYYALAMVFKDVLPPIEKHAIDGELKATKFHLEDLRKLLKIK